MKSSTQPFPTDDFLTPKQQQLQEALSILLRSKGNIILKQLTYLNKIVKQKQQLVGQSLKIKQIKQFVFQKIDRMNSFHRLEKRIIAKVLYESGYGVSKYRDYVSKHNLPIKIVNQVYKSDVCSIFKQFFRNVQNILIEDNQHQYFRLKHRQMNHYLYPSLMNIRKNYSQNFVIFFLKNINNLFALSHYQNIPMNHYEQAYQEIVNFIFKHEANSQKNQKNKLQQHDSDSSAEVDKFSVIKFPINQYKNPNRFFRGSDENSHTIWTPERQKIILQTYLQTQSVASVRDIFQSKFENQPLLYDLYELKKVFVKIIRSSVHILQKFIQDNKITLQTILCNVCPIGEEETKLLIGAPFSVKVYLCELCLRDQLDYRMILQMTAEITKYLQSKIKTNSKSANSPKSKSVCSSKSKR